MIDILDAYTTVVFVVIIGLAPFAVAGAIFLWQLHGEDRRQDSRTPTPLLRLSLILAVTSAMGAISAVILVPLALLALAGTPPAWALQVRITLIVLLELTPLINAGYLLWLRRSRVRRTGKRRPPPWSSDD